MNAALLALALLLPAAPAVEAAPFAALPAAVAAVAPFAPAVAPAEADALERDFAAAVAAYEAGDHAAAAEAFAQLAARTRDPGRRALLHANAGTAAARGEQLGRALWHLESARVGAPRDPSVARNLDLVRAWLAEGDAAPDELPVTWPETLLVLSAAERGLVEAALLTLALLALAGRRAGRLGRGAVVTAVLLVLLAAGLHAAAALGETRRAARAVLLQPADVRAEPAAKSETLFRLAEGAEVRVIESRGEHLLIETADDSRGWVAGERMRRVDVGGSDGGANSNGDGNG